MITYDHYDIILIVHAHSDISQKLFDSIHDHSDHSDQADIMHAHSEHSCSFVYHHDIIIIVLIILIIRISFTIMHDHSDHS